MDSGSQRQGQWQGRQVEEPEGQRSRRLEKEGEGQEAKEPQQLRLDKGGSYLKWYSVIKAFLDPYPVASTVFQLQRVGVEVENQFDALFALSIFACTPSNALGKHHAALEAVKVLPTSLGAPVGFRPDSLPIAPALAETLFMDQCHASDSSSATLVIRISCSLLSALNFLAGAG